MQRELPYLPSCGTVASFTPGGGAARLVKLPLTIPRSSLRCLHGWGLVISSCSLLPFPPQRSFPREAFVVALDLAEQLLVFLVPLGNLALLKNPKVGSQMRHWHVVQQQMRHLQRDGGIDRKP